MKNMKLGCQNPKIGYFLIILAFMSSIQIYDELRILKSVHISWIAISRLELSVSVSASISVNICSPEVTESTSSQQPGKTGPVPNK